VWCTSIALPTLQKNENASITDMMNNELMSHRSIRVVITKIVKVTGIAKTSPRKAE